MQFLQLLYFRNEDVNLFILDLLSAQINLPDTRVSGNSKEYLNHNASTLRSEEWVISCNNILGITNTRCCLLYVRMKHCELHLMISSTVINFQGLRSVIRQRQNGSVFSKAVHVCPKIGPALSKIGSTGFVRMSKKDAFS